MYACNMRVLSRSINSKFKSKSSHHLVNTVYQKISTEISSQRCPLKTKTSDTQACTRMVCMTTSRINNNPQKGKPPLPQNNAMCRTFFYRMIHVSVIDQKLKNCPVHVDARLIVVTAQLNSGFSLQLSDRLSFSPA